ncbi:unnamed protein product [Tilletia controversa]|nr:unnamed protein product [Tilletia controversa]
MAGDLTDIAHVQDLVKRHIERYGGLDILVNNASKQILCSDFAEIDLNNVESTFRSNTLAMHALVKYALTHMKRGASIIQTSSMTAYKGSKGMVDYSSNAHLSLRRDPTLIGEVGVPFDINSQHAFKTGDYRVQSMDALVGAMESYWASFMLWNRDRVQ